MHLFAAICDEIAATPARLEKIERLARYFTTCTPPDLAASARFFTGNPLASADARKVAIGGRTLLAAARAVWSPSDEELRTAYAATGDLGEALARVMRPPQGLALELFADEPLTPASLGERLEAIASFTGAAAGKRRAAFCERVLRAARSPREVAAIVKVLTGELRIGLRGELVLDAIARASGVPPESVRRAAMAAGDVGAVALAARAGSLDSLAVRHGTPIGFMLAAPIVFGSTYRELASGSWLVEDKYDGIRAQAHIRDGAVRLFSRTQSEIGRAFPEIIEALHEAARDAIVDGEIVAVAPNDARDGNARILPFRYLQPRLGRVDPPPSLVAEIPVRFVVFDALAIGDRFMLDEPLAERRALLPGAVTSNDRVTIAPWQTLESGAAPEVIADLFEASRRRGNEGLLLKRTDAPYVPGRRGKWWLKLKRELSTLDVVVVAVEWGHGKRRGVLSDYTFAVRTSATDPNLLTIGKAYSGLTDAEIATMTPWFLEHALEPNATRRTIAVAPEIVIEIAFDIIQKSTLHASGFSLRFPRIVRLRPDKSVAEIDTMASVESIYREMIEREGVAR